MARARAKIIGVIGAAQATPQHLKMAEQVGKLVAEKGGILVTGGLGGIMAAASRGAHDAGAMVIGILPGEQADTANPWVGIPIVTGMSDARNVIIARTADALIAISGKYGTLSEIAFGLKFEKPVICLDSWETDARIVRAATPEEAVALAFRLAQ